MPAGLQQQQPSLVWLRRDLRLEDHAALSAALQHNAPVQLVFVLDADILAQFTNPQDRRVRFLVQTLCWLHQRLQQKGGGLLLLHGKAEILIPQLVACLSARLLCAAKDHEATSRKRDAAVQSAIDSAVTSLQWVDDNFIIFPDSPCLLNRAGKPYQVFTPFARQWRESLLPHHISEYVVNDNGRYAAFSLIYQRVLTAGLPVFPAENLSEILTRIGYAGENLPQDALWQPQQADEKLQIFIQHGLHDYAKNRDFMALDSGTSHLSPFLRFGLVSIRACVRAVLAQENKYNSWLNELIWRDFYAMILYHYPEFAVQEFYPQYRQLPWNRDESLFQAWCEGKTGYPLVDAAMRQLNRTGWMHNRARMVTASFLTKHLLIDWRWGEAYFAQHLMDYELSSNVGGWQWAASTGIDPQPYFRIFNPLLQAQKFDPEQVYIRRYIEEWNTPRYPQPVVEHRVARERALRFYAQKNHQNNQNGEG
jgi:deoxyribodipyrimidine photo-lyase